MLEYVLLPRFLSSIFLFLLLWRTDVAHRFIVWENVRSPRFEAIVLIAILANCVQLALYDPEVKKKKKKRLQ